MIDRKVSLRYRADGIGKPRCDDCGGVLTNDERHHYEHRCEGCERREFDRHQDWRMGEPDPHLDAIYNPRRVTQ